MNPQQLNKETKKNRSREDSTPKTSPRVLIAEDDDEMRYLLAEVFRKRGFEIIACPDGIGLLDHLDSFFLPAAQPEKIDLIVSDVRMPGVTGMEILEGLKDHDDAPPIILITAFGDEETHMRARRLGAAAMLDKPFDIDHLLDKACEILARPDHTIPSGQGVCSRASSRGDRHSPESSDHNRRRFQCNLSPEFCIKINEKLA